MWVFSQNVWSKGGSNISYESKEAGCCSLSFTYKPEREGEVRFAATPPVPLSVIYDQLLNSEVSECEYRGDLADHSNMRE